MNQTTNVAQSEAPQIWHYGLAARSWITETELGRDGAYFHKMVEESGQPALDVGCGGGRLLIPCLQAGLDVEGSDYSADILAVCREALDAAGLDTQLYRQGMHELDLPRRYKTIYACGVVGLGGRKDLTRRGFERVYEHLRPGGTFLFDYQVPWNDPGYWSGWLPENRRDLPLDWFPPNSSVLPNGDTLESSVQIVSHDPLEGVAVRAIRHRLLREGKLVEEDVNSMAMELYTKHELVLMLETAGFRTVEIYGDYTAEPAAADHENLVFIARK